MNKKMTIESKGRIPTLPDISRWHDKKNTRVYGGRTWNERKWELRAMGEAGKAIQLRNTIVENADIYAEAEGLLEMFGETLNVGQQHCLIASMANCLENHEAFMRWFPDSVRRVVEEE